MSFLKTLPGSIIRTHVYIRNDQCSRRITREHNDEQVSAPTLGGARRWFLLRGVRGCSHDLVWLRRRLVRRRLRRGGRTADGACRGQTQPRFRSGHQPLTMDVSIATRKRPSASTTTCRPASTTTSHTIRPRPCDGRPGAGHSGAANLGSSRMLIQPSGAISILTAAPDQHQMNLDPLPCHPVPSRRRDLPSHPAQSGPAPRGTRVRSMFCGASFGVFFGVLTWTRSIQAEAVFVPGRSTEKGIGGFFRCVR